MSGGSLNQGQKKIVAPERFELQSAVFEAKTEFWKKLGFSEFDQQVLRLGAYSSDFFTSPNRALVRKGGGFLC